MEETPSKREQKQRYQHIYMPRATWGNMAAMPNYQSYAILPSRLHSIDEVGYLPSFGEVMEAMR